MFNFYPMRLPSFIWFFYRTLIFKKNPVKPTVYLTFDDGPTPEITGWVLNLLKQENIKGTFFCIGHHIEKFPDIFNRIIKEGHQVGNHTFNHENAWAVSRQTYIKSIEKTTEMIQKHHSASCLFRPPYGRLTPAKIKMINQSGYEIVLWSIIIGDFKKHLSSQHAIDYMMHKVQSGDIIVFHDSAKAANVLKTILPIMIKNLKHKGFKFAVL